MALVLEWAQQQRDEVQCTPPFGSMERGCCKRAFAAIQVFIPNGGAFRTAKSRNGLRFGFNTESWLLQKFSLLELAKGLAQLLLGVHYDRAVPGHRLFQRLS